jgi:hypothetical protein
MHVWLDTESNCSLESEVPAVNAPDTGRDLGVASNVVLDHLSQGVSGSRAHTKNFFLFSYRVSNPFYWPNLKDTLSIKILSAKQYQF